MAKQIVEPAPTDKLQVVVAGKMRDFEGEPTFREFLFSLLEYVWDEVKRPGYDSDWRYFVAEHFKKEFPAVLRKDEENYKVLNPLFKQAVRLALGLEDVK